MRVHAVTAGTGTRVHPGGLRGVCDHRAAAVGPSPGGDVWEDSRVRAMFKERETDSPKTAGRLGPVATAPQGKHV